MRRLLVMLLISGFIGIYPVFAGETHVSGPVSGVWVAGESIFVEAPIWIEEGSSLIIQSGVHIQFKSEAPFVVYGSLTAEGSPLNPILLSAPEDWLGIELKPNGQDLRVLTHVSIAGDAGMPRRVVVGEQAWVDISNCDLRAKESCLDIIGGRVRAYHNRFLSTQILSHTVKLRDLHYGTYPSACEDPTASTLSNDNMIFAMVPDQGQVTPGAIFTTGLWVENCSRLCLEGLAVTVESPGNAVGAYFTYESQQGLGLVELAHSVVTVRTPRGHAQGIVNANNGTLNVVRCTVDVYNEDDPYHDPNGVRATWNADVYLISSSIRLDRGNNYYYVDSESPTIVISSVLTWTQEVLFSRPPEPEEGSGDPLYRWDANGIIIQGPIIHADPEFEEAIDWGTWQTAADLREYYGLRSTSPCIDNGDVQYGYDPDNTLPDIGRFYYPQAANAAPGPGSELPLAIALAPPFPNPFNATTVIPFLLDRSGEVRLSAYNLLGRRVAEFAVGSYVAGRHEARFDASELPSGLYLVAMEFNGVRVAAQPVLLIK